MGVGDVTIHSYLKYPREGDPFCRQFISAAKFAQEKKPCVGLWVSCQRGMHHRFKLYNMLCIRDYTGVGGGANNAKPRMLTTNLSFEFTGVWDCSLLFVDEFDDISFSS